MCSKDTGETVSSWWLLRLLWGAQGPEEHSLKTYPEQGVPMFDRSAVSAGLLLLASHLDLLSLGCWLYPRVISVSFCEPGFSRLFLAL